MLIPPFSTNRAQNAFLYAYHLQLLIEADSDNFLIFSFTWDPSICLPGYPATAV